MTAQCLLQCTRDYSVNMFLRQYWNDVRLAYLHLGYNESLTINSMKDKLWVPDLYFINEKEGNFHMVTTPNLLLRLTPNGNITFSQKITVKLSCPMKLKKFPMDTQHCEMKIESYGYTTNELMFHWIDGVDGKGLPNSVQFSDSLELPEFDKPRQEMADCTMFYLTGSYSCLKVTFILKRKFGFYLIQTYIPSVLIVILSWVSFWIDVQAVPARISLGLLTVLSMTTQSSGARGQLPRVSYIKAIDVWMSTCLIFVFGALIEYAVANVLSRRCNTLKPKLRNNVDNNSDDVASALLGSHTPVCLDRSASLFHRQSTDDINLTFLNDRAIGGGGSFQQAFPSFDFADVSASATDLQYGRAQNKMTEMFNGVNQPQTHFDTHLSQQSANYLTSTAMEIVSEVSHVRPRASNRQDDSSATDRSQPHSHCTSKLKNRETLHHMTQVQSSIYRAEMIDYISRSAFPISFAFFNFLYWLYYLYILD